jgi:ABC-type Fe3+/spermidine/putrescine transport system ATPase subunit
LFMDFPAAAIWANPFAVFPTATAWGPKAMITVQNLHMTFGDFALRDISLTIGKGQYWVILGPSGCGKSVFLQTLAGFFLPELGQIRLNGTDLGPIPPERRTMGLVFQQAALFPHKSVRANIGYALSVRGRPRTEVNRTVDDLIQRMGLGRIVDRPVPTLSGGEAQRVAIARALASHPDVLLLDEPLSALDHNTRLELQDELALLHRTLGLTTVHVTHSREEASALGDHVAIMLGGRIVQQGGIANVFRHPRCSFVAAFLGLDSPQLPLAPACSIACDEHRGECTLQEKK